MGYRDYPIKIKLQEDELELLNQLSKDRGLSSSEVLRDALEYALQHSEQFETHIQARKLAEGQKLFKYWEIPREQRNRKLLEALVGEQETLRCKLMIVRDNLTVKIVPSDVCYASFYDQTLRIRFPFRRNKQYWSNDIFLHADSIISVLTYDARSNQTSDKVPLRFESLTENEYLHITLR